MQLAMLHSYAAIATHEFSLVYIFILQENLPSSGLLNHIFVHTNYFSYKLLP